MWLGTAHLSFQKVLVEQLRALAEIGVDGIELRDFCGRPLDFNPATGKTPDRASWEGGLECLATVPQWQAGAGTKRGSVVFDLRDSSDLAGWTLEGDAFSVSSLPGVFRTPTLNSIGKAGEAATGTALSPPFDVEPGSDALEILFHGGTSTRRDGHENLALRLLDVETGTTLYETVPPSTHVLTRLRIRLDNIKSRTVRLQLVDENTGTSFAWIGVRRGAFVGATH